MPENSRILTLVFTDLADSTALRTQRGDQIVGELIERHRELVRSLAAAAGGRIIDWAGDGCFLTFEIPSSAVTFALQLQLGHSGESDLPGVRMGLHMGEVSERSSPGDGNPRVEGLAVDLAARIEGLAQPGQVLMSAGVANSARQRIDESLFLEPVRWQAYGSYRLKGFDEPLEIREVGLAGVAAFVPPSGSDKAVPVAQQTSQPRRGLVSIAIASLVILCGVAGLVAWSRTRPPDVSNAAEAVHAAAKTNDFGDRPAIAVLPFDNLSPDPEQAFFADGLAEDLITRLSSWRAFPVIARNSSFRYRGGNLDLKQVGAALDARYVVEGSVRRAVDEIRVTAQLIDAASGEHVWAETFDREITDMFTLQDEISETIAASLVSDLTRAEGERARQRGTENLEAWSLFQLGLQHFDRYTLEDFTKARQHFERAAASDPRFATVLRQVAIAGLSELMLGRPDPNGKLASATAASARRAVELDARDPAAQLGLASAYLAAGDPTNGLESIRRAVDLNPSMPEAWIWLGFTQLLMGDPEAAITATERAQRINPQGRMVWIYDNFALAYWEMGRYAAALEAARRLVATGPTYFTGYAYLAMNAVALGQLEDARAAIVAGRRVRPDLSIKLMQGYFGVSRPAVDARRNAALRQAGLE